MRRTSTRKLARRAFAWVAIASGLGFIVVGCLFLRAGRIADDWAISTWNPSSRVFVETRVAIGRGGVFLHTESTAALPGDDVRAVVAGVGPSHRRVVHRVMPGGRRSVGPWLWGDHYRCTPSAGINASGLSDCWTLESRIELLLLALALLPALWTFMWVRARKRRRALGRRGFAVVLPGDDMASQGERLM